MAKVGFIGLGLMGIGMVRNLKKRGHEVTIWNRTPSKAQALEGEGFAVDGSPSVLAAQCDVICTAVSDPAALEAVYETPTGILAGLKERAPDRRGETSGALLVDFSTVSVEAVRRLAGQCQALGAALIDSPMTGSKDGAAAATLVLMVGAEASALARARPVLEAVSEKIVHCGPVGSGTQVKLACNGIVASLLQAFSEGWRLMQASGVDPEKYLEVIQSSGYRSPYFDFKGKALRADDFTTHFAVDLMKKDLGLLADNARNRGLHLPLAETMSEIYQRAQAEGLGREDIASLIKLLGDRGPQSSKQ